MTASERAPWFAASHDVADTLSEWDACADVGWARSLNVEESRLVLAALAEAVEIVELCATDSTAADLAQEVEFLKAERDALLSQRWSWQNKAEVAERGHKAALARDFAQRDEIKRLRAAALQVPACDRCAQGVMDATNSHYLGLCSCECHVESRDGMVTVYNSDGKYVGCMGVETWQRLLTDRAANSQPHGGETT